MVCLLGDQVLPFEINGVRTGNRTDGHRQTGKKGVEVTTANYEKTLLKNGVILRAEDRREKLIKEVGQETPLIGLHVYLNEYPAALLGKFDPGFLSLPGEVLETVMRYHQKYFAVRSADGDLLPEFIAVMNRPDDPDGLIRRGHERVLRARFNDARFFYDFDQKKSLGDRVEDLKLVSFQQQLGSYFDKAQRMVAICAGELGAGPAAQRAALLAKTDLTTEMVKEFTELQGIIGGRYAEAQGEPEAVAKAIYDHYRPLSMEDTIPDTLAGQQVALADKVDTLREFFRIGLIPSGSKDPFALRRAAQGVIRILVEGDVTWKISAIAPQRELAEFLEDRVRYYFRDVQGFRYDEVNAVLAAGFDDVKDALARLEAVQSVRASENFEPLAASFKRIKNILKQAGVEAAGPVREQLLESGPEAGLFAAKAALHMTGQYAADLAAIASMRPAVDAFFDKVMVNVPDAAVRENRLNLLAALLKDSSSIADFSEIVSSGA
jgi:glycyl-tRNA synthetase beta chain